MKLKKILANTMIGAMLLTATPIIISNVDLNTATVEAAKGGAKLSIPKSTPKSNLDKTPSTDSSKSSTSESKSVSGGGKEYAPSKSAKDLQSTTPATKSTPATNSGTGFGNTLRNIGLFAGGMMLGGLIGSLFGGFGGIFGDVLGFLFNAIMIYAAYKGIKFLYNKFRGNNAQNQSQQQFQAQSNNQNFSQTKAQDLSQPIDITPPQASNYPNKSTVGMDYDPKRTADFYRSR